MNQHVFLLFIHGNTAQWTIQCPGMGYEFTSYDGYVQIQFIGQLTVKDLSLVAERLDAVDATAVMPLHRLMDISGAEDICLNFSEMQQFTAKRSAVKPKHKIRFAILAKTPVQYGCARMFQLLSKQPGIKVTVFRDREAALQWVVGGADTEELLT